MANSQSTYIPDRFKHFHDKELLELAKPLQPKGLPLGEIVSDSLQERKDVSLPPEFRKANPHVLILDQGQSTKRSLLTRMIAHDISSKRGAVVLLDSISNLAQGVSTQLAATGIADSIVNLDLRHPEEFSSSNIRRIITDRKILVVIPSNDPELDLRFGSQLVLQIQDAALQFRDSETNVSVYLDEFDQFITADVFADITQDRKNPSNPVGLICAARTLQELPNCRSYFASWWWSSAVQLQHFRWSGKMQLSSVRCSFASTLLLPVVGPPFVLAMIALLFAPARLERLTRRSRLIMKDLSIRRPAPSIATEWAR